MSKNSVALALCLLMLCLAAPCSASELIDEEKMTAQSFNYNTSVVETGAFVKNNTLTGSVYYNKYQVLRYYGGGAHFVDYAVRKSDSVAEGDVLATLTVDGSRAEMTALEMRLAREKDEYDAEVKRRKEELDEQSKALSSQSDPTQAQIGRIAYEKSCLKLEQYQFQTEYDMAELTREIEEMRERFDENRIVAPFAGDIEVLNSTVKSGDAITNGQSLGSMIDPNVFLIVTKDEGMLRYNMPVTVETGSRNARVTYAGRVVAADNVLPDDLMRGYAAIRLDDASVTPDDLKNISISYQSIHLGNVLLVARRAMKMDQGDYYASILTGNMVQKRVVNFSLYNTDVGIALQGLEEGWEVIIN